MSGLPCVNKRIKKSILLLQHCSTLFVYFWQSSPIGSVCNSLHPLIAAHHLICWKLACHVILHTIMGSHKNLQGMRRAHPACFVLGPVADRACDPMPCARYRNPGAVLTREALSIPSTASGCSAMPWGTPDHVNPRPGWFSCTDGDVTCWPCSQGTLAA